MEHLIVLNLRPSDMLTQPSIIDNGGIIKFYKIFIAKAILVFLV